MKYTVYVNYRFYGQKVIEADSQKNAWEIADSMDLDDFECNDIQDFTIADVEVV